MFILSNNFLKSEIICFWPAIGSVADKIVTMECKTRTVFSLTVPSLQHSISPSPSLTIPFFFHLPIFPSFFLRLATDTHRQTQTVKPFIKLVSVCVCGYLNCSRIPISRFLPSHLPNFSPSFFSTIPNPKSQIDKSPSPSQRIPRSPFPPPSHLPTSAFSPMRSAHLLIFSTSFFPSGA